MSSKLHPFFSYFGSKYRIASLYQEPQYETIINLLQVRRVFTDYPDRKVKLYEKYDKLVQLWQYLIEVTEEEILSLPIGPFDKEHPISDEPICPEAQTLIGFWATESQTSASRYPLSKSRGGTWGERKKKLLSNQLQYIRHWKIEHRSYETIDNEAATWYIDPPYQEAGKRYREKSIDFDHLSTWCTERNGHVIVCEQNGANWLPFQTLKHVNNASNKEYKEVVWYNGRIDVR